MLGLSPGGGSHIRVGAGARCGQPRTLYLAVREQGLRDVELAKRLGVSETVVRRMLDPKHDTKPAKLQAALNALGKRIVVGFEDAA